MILNCRPTAAAVISSLVLSGFTRPLYAAEEPEFGKRALTILVFGGGAIIFVWYKCLTLFFENRVDAKLLAAERDAVPQKKRSEK